MTFSKTHFLHKRFLPRSMCHFMSIVIQSNDSLPFFNSRQQYHQCSVGYNQVQVVLRQIKVYSLEVKNKTNKLHSKTFRNKHIAFSSYCHPFLTFLKLKSIAPHIFGIAQRIYTRQQPCTVLYKYPFKTMGSCEATQRAGCDKFFTISMVFSIVIRTSTCYSRLYGFVRVR